MHTNQDILAGFLATIIRTASEGSSASYAVMIVRKFIRNNVSEFPFVNSINLESLSMEQKDIKIAKDINSAHPKKVGEFVTKLTNSLFSDLFKHLIAKKMDPELIDGLNKLGVKM
jgi:hypothetical protein